MAFLAGIDEAGYGPFVGPFAVGFSMFRVPEIDTDLWQVLEPAAVKKPGRKDHRLKVDDSKKVHSGKYGRARLERSVAAFRQLIEADQTDVKSWIRNAPAGPTPWLMRAPWLASLEGQLCPSVSAERTTLDTAALHRCLQAQGCALDAFGCRLTPAGEWNHWIQTTRNKGETLFQITMEVVRHLLDRTGHAPLRIELDRHGGRLHYGSRLYKALSPSRIESHGETKAGSTYTLHYPNRQVQLRFSEKADETHLPVSLASLAAKQSRERCMDAFNTFWAQHLPETKPTKGYGVDGKRWLGEVEGLLEGFRVDTGVVRRVR
jgi:hypothetical protein